MVQRQLVAAISSRKRQKSGSMSEYLQDFVVFSRFFDDLRRRKA